MVGIDRSRLVGRSFGPWLPQVIGPRSGPCSNGSSLASRTIRGLHRNFGSVSPRGGVKLKRGRRHQTEQLHAHAPRCPWKRSRKASARLTDSDITASSARRRARCASLRHRRLFDGARRRPHPRPGTRKITDANPFMTQLLGLPARAIGRQGTVRDRPAQGSKPRARKCSAD